MVHTKLSFVLIWATSGLWSNSVKISKTKPRLIPSHKQFCLLCVVLQVKFWWTLRDVASHVVVTINGTQDTLSMPLRPEWDL